MTTREQLQETLCDRLFWHTAERDDAEVADYLYHRREMDVVYAMDEATLFDSFFNYLQEIEVFPFLDHLDPQKQQIKNVSFLQLVLVLLIKVVGSIKTTDEISDLLLTDELLMSMCGFNAYQVKNGNCRRGVKIRKTPIPEIRGSLCVDTVANHNVTITPRRIENLFSRCIQQLATQGVFPRKIHAACDATLYETTSKFKGCGSVTYQRKVKARGYRKSGELKKVSVTLYGWKVGPSMKSKRAYLWLSKSIGSKNRTICISFRCWNFGILPSHEVFMLANVPVRDIEKELNINRDQVYAKYTDVSLTENS